jgi:hypothetical protein
MFRPPSVAIFRKEFFEEILQRTLKQSANIKCQVAGKSLKSMLKYKILIQLFVLGCVLMCGVRWHHPKWCCCCVCWFRCVTQSRWYCFLLVAPVATTGTSPGPEHVMQYAEVHRTPYFFLPFTMSSPQQLLFERQRSCNSHCFGPSRCTLQY